MRIGCARQTAAAVIAASSGFALAVSLAFAFRARPAGADDFANFESSHVHPIALSENGGWLYAVNTPEARLAIFRVRGDGSLRFAGDVPVGLEPVSLAVRPGTREVWVCNHLSDSVSVVDTSRRRVVATLDVGDEPNDVVFAGGRAFVALSGKDDRVDALDAESRERVASIPIFSDDPRALAASDDGRRVFAVALLSGSATTSLHPIRKLPPPDPPRDPTLPPAPRVGLIVRLDPATGRWLDETGRDRSGFVGFTLPDEDLFVIDAAAPVPYLLEAVRGVGTNLFDVIPRPHRDEVWVPNTDARNFVRFEPVLRGHLVATRVSIARFGTSALEHVDLNPHIDYSVTPGPPDEVELSLAQPGDGVFDPDGNLLYLTAFGSAAVAEIEAATGAVLRRIAVGGGPSGVTLHDRKRRLYVLGRFDNRISVVDLDVGAVLWVKGVAGPAGFDPSPEVIRRGRRFLYDARLTSGHGDASCATCHLFADRDGLGWDLGDPQGAFVFYEDADWLPFSAIGDNLGFDPMKGPMTTQTLRGLPGMEPFHWRGDRRNFEHFNGAFATLLGRAGALPDADIRAFADFIMTVRLPPNPYRLPDGSLPASIATADPESPGSEVVGDPAAGADIFFGGIPGVRGPCTGCHALPAGTNNQVGATARSEDFKIPHLRNVYEKVARDLARPGSGVQEVGSGFGLLNDGVVSLGQITGTFAGPAQPDLAAFVLSFPTGTPSCVGRQVEASARTRDDPRLLASLGVLIAAAHEGRCDLIARGSLDGRAAAYAYEPQWVAFAPSRRDEDPRATDDLLAALHGNDLLTWMTVPVGSGARLGIDRDRDGCLDGDERRQGTDPAHPGTPAADGDLDGIPDAIDRCPAWYQSDRTQYDRDGDGIPNECQCGDVDGDGHLDGRDVRYLLLHLFGRTRLGTALARCNVSGNAGRGPERCDWRDLFALRNAVYRSGRSRRTLPQLCRESLPPPHPGATVCVDAETGAAL